MKVEMNRMKKREKEDNKNRWTLKIKSANKEKKTKIKHEYR